MQNARKREIHWDVIGIFLLISPRAFNSIFHFLDQNGVDMYIQIHPRKDWPQMSYDYNIWILFPEMSMGYDSKNNRWGLDVFFQKFLLFVKKPITRILEKKSRKQFTILDFVSRICRWVQTVLTARAHQMPFFRCKFNMTGIPAFLSVFQTLKSVSIKLCK